MTSSELGNLFRFIHDHNVINNGWEFENNYKGIYPEELPPNKENSEKLVVSFLDFLIKIEIWKFIVGIFDKRENFHFSMDKIAYKLSNLSPNMFYSAIRDVKQCESKQPL